MFSSKQQVVILLTHPEVFDAKSWVNPTLRDLKRGLKKHFGNDLTTRHIRRLLRDLTNDGIIEREIPPPQLGIYGNQAQATRYTVVDFNKVFSGFFSSVGFSKVVLARERKRRKIRELRKRSASN
ncbi:hypothetical protein ES703_38852 [subsurface metagenome]